MTSTLLELQDLSGGYPPVSVFRDISLVFSPDETLGIFGPNGHGKTTLLKTVAGLIDPWRGGVYFDGHRLNAEGDMPARPSEYVNYDFFRRRRTQARTAAQAGLIYVMQNNLLFPELTVEEVLAIAPQAAFGRPGIVQMKDTVDHLFPRLKERWQSKIRYLSGGERQMASIAAGLLAMPRLLILDEPTLGLSPKLRVELANAIHTIRDSGVPLIVVDQNAQFLSNLVSRLVLFEHGSITREFKGSNVPDHDELITMMFGETRG